MKNTKKTTDEFIIQANLIHENKYRYNKSNYLGAKIKLIITCQIHGDFEQTPDNHINNKQGCSNCCNNVKMNENEFIEKAKLIHGDKYEYSKVYYINNRTKVKIICPIHGVFEQTPYNHLRGDMCSACFGNKRLTTLEFIEKAKLIHGNKYDYSKVEYKNNSTKIKITCPIHGEFEQTPNGHLNKNGCPICKESKGETQIAKWLDDNNIKYIRQHRFPDCRDKQPLPFDFYLPEHNTCIEYNGRQHYISILKWGGETGLRDRQNKDNIKIKYCNSNSIKVLIIKYTENVNNKLNKILISPKTLRVKI